MAENPSSKTAPAGNRLGEETSPYLLQHKDNPVHWQAWGAGGAGRRPRPRDKPILLSIGYAACHWCHVMAHESFENPAIAALMNELFVNIKVDREERPDLDAIYQNGAGLAGRAGRLAADDVPDARRRAVLGRHLFPAGAALGPAGLSRRCCAPIADAYRDEPRQGREERRRAARGAGQARSARARAARIAPELARPHRRAAAARGRSLHGGIGSAPKFPQMPIFELLWRAWKRTGDARYREAVDITLTRMCQGGIYDHLGGGFARYATDADGWCRISRRCSTTTPQLVDLLTLVWQETPRAALRAARPRDDRLAAARDADPRRGHRRPARLRQRLDADSEHEEGKFYVWTEAEIDAVLGADAPLFKQHYDVRPEGNWEEHTILNRSAQPLLMDDATEARARSAAAQAAAPGATAASARASTTRCWPIGTG